MSNGGDLQDRERRLRPDPGGRQGRSRLPPDVAGPGGAEVDECHDLGLLGGTAGLGHRLPVPRPMSKSALTAIG